MADETGAAEGSHVDRLNDIFTRQATLGETYRQARPQGFYSLPSIEKCTTWTRAIIHECCELDDELNWKPWKNPQSLDHNREQRLLETADILHFLVQLALDQGFSADDLYQAYLAKNQVNRDRQQNHPEYSPTERRRRSASASGSRRRGIITE